MRSRLKLACLATGLALVAFPGSALADDQPTDPAPPDINLCEWEPMSCNGGEPGPPKCEPTPHGSKICIIVDPPICEGDSQDASGVCSPPPVDPPVVPLPPPCSVDPDSGETTCPEPPTDICMTSRFASEAAAIEAGCLPPPECVVAETAPNEVSCVDPPPCVVDEEGNKICAVYDMAPKPKTGKPKKPAPKKPVPTKKPVPANKPVPAKKQVPAKKPATKKPSAPSKPAPAKKPTTKKPTSPKR